VMEYEFVQKQAEELATLCRATITEIDH
jgi:hypothetical protein